MQRWASWVDRGRVLQGLARQSIREVERALDMKTTAQVEAGGGGGGGDRRSQCTCWTARARSHGGILRGAYYHGGARRPLLDTNAP